MSLWVNKYNPTSDLFERKYSQDSPTTVSSSAFRAQVRRRKYEKYAK